MIRRTDTKQLPDAQVLLIDDDPLFLRAVKRLLDKHGYHATTYDSFETLTNAGPLPQVGCAVLDLNLPGSGGLEIQDKLKIAAPALSVIFLTGFAKVPSTVRAMKAGALDFLEKPAGDDLLISAVRRAIDRSRQLYGEHLQSAELRRNFESLTARERQVFALITSGLLNKQAAYELKIAEKTVKFHRARLMAKMGVESLAELARAAERLASGAEFVPSGSMAAEANGASRSR